MRTRKKEKTMKKKIVSGILIAATVLALTGCGSSGEKQISGNVNNNEQAKTEQQSGAGSNQDSKKNETTGKDYVFKTKNTEITIDAEAANILSQLGDPLSKFDSPSCAFGDLDVIYTYGGFEVDTYQLKGVDYISAVILQDDSVSTQEGLYIGEDASKVEEIYGKPSEVNGTNKIYTGKNMKLTVIIKDGKVSSIQYLNLKLS